MKTQFERKLIVVFSFTLALLLFACQKSDDITYDEITGSYIGTISTIGSDPSITIATADIRQLGNQIEVHCYGGDFDATVMLDVFQNGNDIMVCLTGEDFNNMYGHMPGNSNWNWNGPHHDSDWMQHLNNEHQQGDEHFGNFDMQHHTFNYTFQMSNGDFHFQGTRN